MKVIFLDIDGVLNTEVFITAIHELFKGKNPHQKMMDKFGHKFDPLALRFLNYIIEKTGAKIVISSSWRLSGLKRMQEMWKARNLCGEVIDITPCLMSKSKLPFDERFERGTEIKMWLDENPVESYVIIDDDNDMLPEQQDNFVMTNQFYGITLQDAEKAIKILNGN